MKKEWSVKIRVNDKRYVVKENSIDVYEYMMPPYGNGMGTKYLLKGKKTVEISEYNRGWAGRGMGMDDARYKKIIDEPLYKEIRSTIDKIKKIEETVKDADEQYEQEAEILQNFDIDYDYDPYY